MMSDVATQISAISQEDFWSVNNFIALEARLADQSKFAEWENLWADEMACNYWVVASEETDPDNNVAYIRDNRVRIRSRVRQWLSGTRYSATGPGSRLARAIGPLELLRNGAAGARDVITVRTSFVLVQYRDGGEYLWAGQLTYDLLRHEGGWRLLAKKVELVNREGFIPVLTFII